MIAVNFHNGDNNVIVNQLYPSIMSGEEKSWLAAEIILGNETPKSIGNKYGINPKLVRKWVRHVKGGKILYADMGRPRLLDKTSIISIKNLCMEKNDINNDDLMSKIIIEQHETLSRRNVGEMEGKKMSRRSMKRYLNEYLEQSSCSEGDDEELVI